MAKKIISVLIAAIMLLSTVAVSSFAEEDYKYKIDTELLHANDDGAYDANISAHCLTFWADEIQTAYASASTQAEWQALYEKMCTPHEEIEGLEDFPMVEDGTVYWYKYRDESKAVMNLRYVADKTTAVAGDTVTVDLYATSNFWLNSLEIGVIFDKTRYTALSATFDLTALDGWEESCEPNLHYGFTDKGEDLREVQWPKSLVDQKTTSYDKYSMVKALAIPDVTRKPIIWNKMFNNTHLLTFTFKVNDDAALGESLFFVTPDSSYQEASYADYLLKDNFNALCNYYHTYGENASDDNTMYIDQMYQFGQTTACESAAVTIQGASEKADYTALDAAISDYNDLVPTLNDYTPDSWLAYSDASAQASAVDRNLDTGSQNVIDEATTALTTAKANLVRKAFISAEAVGVATLNSMATLKFTVAGSPVKIRLVDADTNAFTFNRADATITKDGNNEVWTVKQLATKESQKYTAYVYYDTDNAFSETKDVTLTAQAGLDLSVHSMDTDGIYVQDSETDRITSGRHEIQIKTSTDVMKVQFIDDFNNTCTYDMSNCTAVDNDGIRTWTINFNFWKIGDCHYYIRTRAKTTSFATTGDELRVTVLY